MSPLWFWEVTEFETQLYLGREIMWRDWYLLSKLADQEPILTAEEVLKFIATHYVVKAGPNNDKNQYGHLELWWAADSVAKEGSASVNPQMMLASAENSYSLAAIGGLRAALDEARKLFDIGDVKQERLWSITDSYRRPRAVGRNGKKWAAQLTLPAAIVVQSTPTNIVSCSMTDLKLWLYFCEYDDIRH